MKIKSILILISLSILTFGQSNEADELLNQIKNKLNKVNDYSANVEVSVNMDFLKMPKSKAELYFKKPDKFKFHSNNFAILPKAGVDFNPQKILDNDFAAVIVGDTLVDSSLMSIVKIISESDSSKFNSAKLFIDRTEILIKQMFLDAGEGSSIITEFNYDDQKEFGLPSEIKVSLDFTETENENSKKRRSKIPSNFKGDITIRYTDYKVNQGIDDSVFIDEEENSEEERKEKK
jgi:outer membrane lipoprotein-sorting protein